MLSYVVGFLLKNKLQLVFLVLCCILSAFIEVAMPYVTAKFVDDVLVSHSSETFYWFVGAIFFISVIAIISQYFSIVISAKIQVKAINDATYEILNHIHKLSNQFFLDNDMIYLSKRIDNDIYDVVSFVLKGLLQSLVNILFLTATLFLFISIDSSWFLLFVLVAVLYIIVYNILRGKMFSLLLDVREKQNQYFARFTDNFLFIQSIKYHSLYKEFMQRFQNTFNAWFTASIKEAKLSLWFSSSRDMTNKILIVIIFFFGGIEVLNGNLSVGNFIALSGYYALAFSGLAYFLNLGHEYQSALSAYSRLKEIHSLPIAHNGDYCFEDGIRAISLKSIRYAFSNKMILKNFSCDFSKGNIYCVVGKNGSGKSTILKLILGIISPQEGTIEYNGIEVKKVDLISARRNNISVVEQIPFVVDDSVYNNLKIGLEQIDEILYNELISKFKLDVVLKRQIDNTFSVTDKLSGGEKQKIALIRGLLKKSNVLLLDEPESNLDADSLKVLLELIRKCKYERITIIVSHEPQVIDLADKIIRVNEIDL